MKKIKKIFNIGILLFLTVPIVPIFAEQAPTCSISFTPQVVEVGKYVTVIYRTTGLITSISQKGTGDLSWKGFGGGLSNSSTQFVISLNTGNYSTQIKTYIVGTATLVATITGSGGSSTCTASYTVKPKSISKDSIKNVVPEGLKEGETDINKKQEVLPTVSENQSSGGKTIFVNNEIIYSTLVLLLILTLFIVLRFLKSKGIIKIPSIKRKWLIITLIIITSVVIISSASYFGIKQYKEYQTEKKMLPIVLQVQKLVKQGKNDEVLNLVKDFTDEDKRVFKKVLNKEKIDIATEAEQSMKEKSYQEAQKQKDLEVDKLKQEVEALKNKKPVFFKTETKTTDTESQNIINPPPSNYYQQSTPDLAKYIVRIICSNGSSINSGDSKIVGGSGTIYGLNKFIMTNFHVVDGAVLCKVGITDDIKNPPSKWYEATIGTAVPDLDIATLKPTQALPDSVNTVAYNICLSEEIKLGDDIIVLGYPGVGGNTITATEGVISGFEGYRIKTSAKIEHGNSGGGAFLKKNGCWFGIPTSVTIGELESLGSIINYSLIHEQSQ